MRALLQAVFFLATADAARKVSVHSLCIRDPGLELSEIEYVEPANLPDECVDLQIHACCLPAPTCNSFQASRSAASTHSLDLTPPLSIPGEWGPVVLPLVPGREAWGWFWEWAAR